MGALNNVVMENDNQRVKTLFDMSHNLNTTFAFGEMQILNCQLLPVIGNSSFRVSNLTRCFPLSAPCYGRIATKTFSYFIGFSDLFPKWKQMFSNQLSTVMAQNPGESVDKYSWLSSSINTLPNIDQFLLINALVKRSHISIYTKEGIRNRGTWRFDAAATPKQLANTFRNRFLGGCHYSHFDEDNATIQALFVNSLDDPNYFAPGDADFHIHTTYNNRNYFATVKLNAEGRRLLKLFRGLGYPISFVFKNDYLGFSVLPLLAAYKAYFTQFGLVQYDQWEQTACYKLIELFSHSSNVYARSTDRTEERNLLSSGSTQQIDQHIFSHMKYGLYDQFFDELADMFYTDVNTLESMAIPLDDSMNASKDRSYLFNMLSDFQSDGQTQLQGRRVNVVQDGNYNARIDSYSNRISQIEDTWLKALFLAVNKQTQIGSDIEKALIERGYQDFVDKCSTHFIGATSSEMSITEVTSTTDTASLENESGKVLGAPAGRGVSYDENKEFHYENHEPGYIITLGCIVPITDTTQRIDPTLQALTVTDFYNPLADGLGFSAIPVGAVGYTQGVEHIEDSAAVDPDDAFGRAPRYWEFKMRKGVMNGAFAIPSEMDSVLPYCLDSVMMRNPLNIKDYDIELGESFKTDDVEGGQKFTDAEGGYIETYEIPDAGKVWQKTLKSAFFGRFDRIFNQLAEHINDRNLTLGDNYGYRDSFIFHTYIEFRYNAPMLPISLGYGTVEDNDARDKKTTKVKR